MWGEKNEICVKKWVEMLNGIFQLLRCSPVHPVQWLLQPIDNASMVFFLHEGYFCLYFYVFIINVTRFYAC